METKNKCPATYISKRYSIPPGMPAMNSQLYAISVIQNNDPLSLAYYS